MTQTMNEHVSKWTKKGKKEIIFQCNLGA
jgi:hypothetical protein